MKTVISLLDWHYHWKKLIPLLVLPIMGCDGTLAAMADMAGTAPINCQRSGTQYPDCDKSMHSGIATPSGNPAPGPIGKAPNTPTGGTPGTGGGGMTGGGKDDHHGHLDKGGREGREGRENHNDNDHHNDGGDKGGKGNHK